ncbi:MAG: hypothetical protein JNK25_10035 [Phycisphaerae bacterium]|nr:hypothetical protein [Phycisphaerae bacterium]
MSYWYDQAEWYEHIISMEPALDEAMLRRVLVPNAPGGVRCVREPIRWCGRPAIPLVRTGYEVIGCDLNRAMPEADLREQGKGCEVQGVVLADAWI